MVDVLKVDRCFEPYLPEEATLEDIKPAYRQAVKEVHPDSAGSRKEELRKAFYRVNESAERLKLVMDEGETYRIEPKAAGSSEKDSEGFSSNTEGMGHGVSARECWEDGIEEINRYLDNEYRLTDHRSFENRTIGWFDSGSKPSFAIELETLENLLSYEITYFADGKGELESFEDSRLAFKIKDREEYVREMAVMSVRRAERIETESPR